MRYKLPALGIFLGAALLSVVLYKLANQDPCQQLAQLNTPPEAKQVVMVQAQDGVQAQLTACAWRQDQWQSELFAKPIAAVIGKKGLAPLGAKKEGDRKTPAGLYPIMPTFGTQPLALKMDYKYITAEDKFIDDPQHKDYNTWVIGPTTARSYEPMRIPLYKLGAVVNYNMNPIVPGAGSAIFLHLWQSANKGTNGCIAMSEEHLLHLLQWLDKTQHPYIYVF